MCYRKDEGPRCAAHTRPAAYAALAVLEQDGDLSEEQFTALAEYASTGQGQTDLQERLTDTADPQAAVLSSAIERGRSIAAANQEYANRVRSNGFIDDSIPELPQPGEPTKVILLRGMPASGKSTWSQSVIDAHPTGTVARINNDDIAYSLFGSHNVRTAGSAALLQQIREAALSSLMQDPDVRLVIVDNTNLSLKTVNSIAKLTLELGGEPSVDDRFLAVPLKECLRRNSKRDRKVPDDVMHKMYSQVQKTKPWQPPEPFIVEPYSNDNPDLPETVIVDVDGTLAIAKGRSFYDWKRVGEDDPNPPVVDHIKGLLAQGKNVIVMSGRDGSCRQETEEWLEKHVGPGLTLHMREANDMRPDSVVKYELFNAHIRDQYRVSLVLDDRDQVVKLWRDQLQLPTWQVANGNF